MIVKPNTFRMCRAPLGYFGGKTKLRPTIISCIPDHDTYVEVFCGSGTVFFGKPPSKNEIINDVHSELVNLMKVISGTYFDSSIRQEFISYVRTMPASREAHKEWQKWDDIKLESLNPAQRAFIYYYCTKNGFSCVKKGGYAASPLTKNRYNMDTDFEVFCARFRSTSTQIEHMDFRDLIEKYNQSIGNRNHSGICFYCFAAGSMVRMHNEVWREIETVVEGEKTWGNKTVLTKVKRRYEGIIYNITVQGSPYALRVTPEHPVLAIKGRDSNTRQDKRSDLQMHEQMEFYDAKDLRIGDYLCVPVGSDYKNTEEWDWKFPVYKEPTNFRKTSHSCVFIQHNQFSDVDISELLGLYASEGNIGRTNGVEYSVVWSFNTNEVNLIEFVKKTLNKYFGIKSVTTHVNNNATQIIASSILLSKFIQYWIPGTSRNRTKHINQEFLCAPNNMKESFLKGWMKGDGGIYFDRNKTKAKLTGTSVCKDMAVQIYHMFLHCGYRPSFKLRTKNVGRTIIFPSGNKFITTNVYDVYLSICSEIENFGYRTRAKKVRATRRIIDGYILSRIRSIKEEEYNGYVYNLDVDGDNLLCVDNVVSHNCDPPYFIADNTGYYEFVFTQEDHKDLKKCCDSINNLGNKFLITYDDNPGVIDLYKDYFLYRTDPVTYTALEEKDERKIFKCEIFVTNYDLHEMFLKRNKINRKGNKIQHIIFSDEKEKKCDDNRIEFPKNMKLGEEYIGLTKIN